MAHCLGVRQRSVREIKMKVLCVRCDGSGVIFNYYRFTTMQWTEEPCPDCDGSGYLSNEPIVMPVSTENYCRYVEYRKVP